jgi:hypothetical protein
VRELLCRATEEGSFVILDVCEHYEKIGDQKDPDFIRRGGVVFAWSESNCQYERAWWLYPDAPRSPLRDNLRRTRPLPEGETL